MIEKLRNWGLGMTELIIIISLVAIAVIAVYGFFGDAIRSQAGLGHQDQQGQEAGLSIASGSRVHPPADNGATAIGND